MTQMFFDNKKYFESVDACRSIVINVPINPGLKQITKKKWNIVSKFSHIRIGDTIFGTQKYIFTKRI
jgi:methylenetetrahydrofolate reductase (NADPH)